MSAAAAETHASILSLPQLVNNDAGLVRRGRYLTATFLVEAGDTEFLVRVVEGRLASVERGPFLLRSWTFALRASPETWQRFWEPTPAPGYHDLFAPRARDAGRAHELADLLRRQMLSRSPFSVSDAPRWSDFPVFECWPRLSGRRDRRRNRGRYRLTFPFWVLFGKVSGNADHHGLAVAKPWPKRRRGGTSAAGATVRRLRTTETLERFARGYGCFARWVARSARSDRSNDSARGRASGLGRREQPRALRSLRRPFSPARVGAPEGGWADQALRHQQPAALRDPARTGRGPQR